MTVTTTEHAAIRADERGMLTIRCCGWSATACTPEDRRWAERALLAHQGRHVDPEPRPCHSACEDEPACLYDGEDTP